MISSISPSGDRAITVEFENEINEEVNAEVYALQESLDCPGNGIVEMVPTFRSLLIFYDPRVTGYHRLTKVIRLNDPGRVRASDAKKKVLIVPCLYGGESGEDLEGLTRELQLSESEIIRLHSETTYRIYMMGFLPGFVYLGGLNKKIWAPRLKTPRTLIPEGSVGIGGNQTGVYPIGSPGGWRLIGRTPLKFYDPDRKNAILCKAGEYIRFQPVSEREYIKIRSDVEADTWKTEYLETW